LVQERQGPGNRLSTVTYINKAHENEYSVTVFELCITMQNSFLEKRRKRKNLSAHPNVIVMHSSPTAGND
jgi:hypothetical protein